MKPSVEIRDGILIHHLKGEMCFGDVINSWGEIFANLKNLSDFRGILTDLVEAEVCSGPENLDMLADSLTQDREQSLDLRIAIVRDAPGMVTKAILLNSRLKKIDIRPFATREAALLWLSV